MTSCIVCTSEHVCPRRYVVNDCTMTGFWCLTHILQQVRLWMRTDQLEFWNQLTHWIQQKGRPTSSSSRNYSGNFGRTVTFAGIPLCEDGLRVYLCALMIYWRMQGMSMEHIYTEIKQWPCRRIARDCLFVVHDLSCIDNTCLERSGMADAKQEHGGVGEEELHLIAVQSE